MRKCLVETVLLPVLLQPAVQLCSCLSLRIHYHQGTNKLMIMMIFSLISMLSLSSSVAAVDIPLANYSGTSNYRFLQNQNSDWQAFNDLIYNAVVRFPDSSMKNAGLTLKVKNLQCTNIQLTDITVGSSQTSAQEVVVSTTISGLNMVCNADYEFEGWLFVGGSGNLYLESFNNQAVLQTAFDSLNYNQYPPHDTSIKACQPTININTLDFSNGGFLGWTLDQLQSMFRGRFESMAEDRFCAELDQMSNENMDTLLNDLSNRLAQYPADIVIDPLQPEKNDLLGPATANVYFIDWQKPESYAYGVWMDQAWQEIAKFLNQEVALGPSGQVDKNANQLLREHILEEDGVLVMTMEDEEQNILFEDHDQWTQTRVTVNEIRVEGLDTLTNLDPMVYIGKYTMQSNLVWEKLMFEVDMTMEIKPSTIPGSYITGATSSGITEHVTVEFSMSQVQASIAILLAINQKKLEALQVGHFLDRDQILPCLLSSIYKVEVASFSVEVLDLEPRRLSGFVSRGLDRVVSKAVEAAFLMYEASLLRSSRAFFQTAIRKVVNEKVEAQYASYGQTKCVLWELPSAPGAVDFRDLLLEPDQAVLFGGSGTERYGNLFSTFVMPTMREHILTEDKMNENILRPYTLTQSGEEGVVLAVSPLHQYVQETGSQLNSTWISLLGWDRFELKIFDSAVRNIDTIVSPIEILEPLMNAQKLSNTLRTGASRPLTFSSRFSLFAQSNDANLEMYNELDMSLSIPSSLISFNLLTALNETSLLQFPLKDLTNQFCWLSALFDQANVENEALDLQGILISFSSFDFDLACISCSSPGSVYLSEIISEIKNADFLTLIRPNIEGAMTEVALNAWENMNTTGMIRDAANLCPHNPSFKPTSVAKRSYGWSNSLTTFSWSQKSVETLVTMGYVALVAAAIVVSENHLLQEGQDPVADSESDFGWNQTTAGYNFSGIRLLDWSNLSATVGLWADGALKDALQYLKEPVAIKASVHTKQSTSLGTNSSRQDEYSTEDFRANALIREFLLDDDGILYLPFDNIHFEVAGIDVQLQEARIVGLDSIVELDAFNITGPQTLQYYLSLRSLDMVLKLQVRSDQVFRNMSLFLSFDDIVADLSMVLAIDLDKLGIMELRSLLKTSNIIPCLIQGAAHEVFISNLHVSIGKMDEPVFDGITSPSLRHAITSVEKSLFSKYTEDIRAAVPGIFDTTLRTLFNDKLKELVLRQSTESCSVNLDSDHFLDFRDLFLPAALARSHGGSGRVPYGDLFEKMYQVLNQELTKKDNDGGLTINTLVSSWTSDQSNSSGVLAFPGDLLETSANLKFGGLDAVLGLRLSEVYIFNLNSLGSPISIFDPVERHSLNNTVSVGIGPEPLVVNANILFTLSDNGKHELSFFELQPSSSVLTFSFTSASRRNADQ